MLSKKTLSALLTDNQFSTDPKQIGYEAFGRAVYAFIPVRDMAERAKLEQFLSKAGHKPSTTYNPGKPWVEVQVSYFKAWHFDI